MADKVSLLLSNYSSFNLFTSTTVCTWSFGHTLLIFDHITTGVALPIVLTSWSTVIQMKIVSTATRASGWFSKNNISYLSENSTHNFFDLIFCLLFSVFGFPVFRIYPKRFLQLLHLSCPHQLHFHLLL